MPTAGRGLVGGGYTECRELAQTVLLAVVAVAVFGVCAQWLAWRLGVPSILLLLVAGFFAGPVTGLLNPDELLGDLLLPVVSLSVALILYEGGLTLRVADLPKVGGIVWSLVSVGALLTWMISALGAYLLFDLKVGLSILLGAILVVTGPTVIGPLLQHIRPTGKSGAVLRWEGIIIDPIGALLAVLVFEAIAVANVADAATQISAGVLKTVFFGGGLGLAAAGLLTLMIHRYWIPDFLQNATSLMFVVGVFALANSIQHESGLLAVTVMGFALVNQPWADVRHIVEFKENLRVLLISALFILLSARLRPEELTAVLGAGTAYVLLLVVFARPLSVMVATVRGRLSRADRTFLAVLAPRGIVAAAVSSVFALRLESIGFAAARGIVPITFIVIIGTVAIYGIAAPIIARRLGVAEPNPQGVLFVGALPWVRALAQTLKEKGLPVLLADTSRVHTAAARMAGLPTYTGSVLSDHALDEIDLGGIGHLLAVTPNEWVNILAVQRFRPIFGRRQCYQLTPQGQPAKHPPHRHLRGRPLFGRGMDSNSLQEELSKGAVIKATPMSESFDFTAFESHYGETVIPLLLLDENLRLTVLTPDTETKPKPGQTIIALAHEVVSSRSQSSSDPVKREAGETKPAH